MGIVWPRAVSMGLRNAVLLREASRVLDARLPAPAPGSAWSNKGGLGTLTAWGKTEHDKADPGADNNISCASSVARSKRWPGRGSAEDPEGEPWLLGIGGSRGS